MQEELQHLKITNDALFKKGKLLFEINRWFH